MSETFPPEVILVGDDDDDDDDEVVHERVPMKTVVLCVSDDEEGGEKEEEENKKEKSSEIIDLLQEEEEEIDLKTKKKKKQKKKKKKKKKTTTTKKKKDEEEAAAALKAMKFSSLILNDNEDEAGNDAKKDNEEEFKNVKFNTNDPSTTSSILPSLMGMDMKGRDSEEEELDDDGEALIAEDQAQVQLELRQVELKKLYEKHGKDSCDQDILTKLFEVATAKSRGHDHDGVIEVCELGLKKCEEAYGKDSKDWMVSSFYSCMGTALMNREDDKDRKRSMDIFREILSWPCNHKVGANVAETITRAGQCAFQLGLLKETTKYAQRALDMLFEIHGEDAKTPKIAHCWYVSHSLSLSLSTLVFYSNSKNMCIYISGTILGSVRTCRVT